MKRILLITLLIIIGAIYFYRVEIYSLRVTYLGYKFCQINKFTKDITNPHINATQKMNMKKQFFECIALHQSNIEKTLIQSLINFN